MSKYKPPFAMKRRAFIEILGSETIKITNSYNTKEFKLKFGHPKYIDLVTLKESDKGIFIASLLWEENATWVEVTNYQDHRSFIEPILATSPGSPKAANYFCTIIEE